MAPLHYYSRSAVTTDWKCRQKRLLNYHWGGRGLTPDTAQYELFLGTIVHDALAGIAHGIDIDSLAEAARDQMIQTLEEQPQPDREEYALEQATLVEGLIRGFYRATWPKLQALFPTIVHIEKEFLLEHGPEGALGFLAKPDLLVRDEQGALHYVEYKTTSSNKEEWVNSWQTAIQLHSSVEAVEKEMGEPVESVRIIGLYKGYVSYNRQNSPLCYLYYKQGNPPFTKDQWSYDYKSGFNKYPVWRREGGVKQLVEEMPLEVLAGQFPLVPPIFPDKAMVGEFFRQTTIREVEIYNALEEIKADRGTEELIDRVFPKMFEQCVPSWGRPCPYVPLCHGQVDQPLSGGFSLRESHHDIEEQHLKKGDSSGNNGG